MNTPTENIHFTKGLKQIPPIRREAFYKEVRNILNVTTNVSMYRRANGKYGTSEKEQQKLDKVFRKYGVVNWKGKFRKRVKQESQL